MKKQDFILIAVIVLIAGVIFGVTSLTAKDGAYVQVEQNGRVTQTLPLNIDSDTVIKTVENETNTLLIRNGYASVTQASCPDKICVRHKKISKNGETIICLPHKLVITVVDKKTENDIDLKI